MAAAAPADTLVQRRDRAQTAQELWRQVQRPGTLTRSEASSQLLGLLQNEPYLPLKKFYATRLLQKRSSLSRPQQQQVTRLARNIFPRSLPIPTSGPIEVRHFIGEEFFSRELKAYQQMGFTVKAQQQTAQALRGRLHVKLYRGDSDIFRHMSDPRTHAIIFSGHSNVGGVNELALTTAPKQRGGKLLALLECIGAQTLPLVAARYDQAHIITTKSSSYEETDQNLIRALLDGLERGQTYRQIRREARRTGEIGNYFFPDQVQATAHLDLDKNGRLDFGRGRSGDGHFSVLDGRQRAPGQKLLSALSYLNSANKYYVEDTPRAIFTRRQVEHRLISGGLAPADPRERVTLIRPRQVQGQKVFEVQLNGRYAHWPKASVAAASIFEITNYLTRTLRGGSLTPRDQLRSLLFAVDYLYRLTPYQNEADRAMAALCHLHGLPKLTYLEVGKIIAKDAQKLASDQQLRALQKLVQARRP
jgi:hypothetical protein